jgi:hypothetical protein
VDLKPMERDDVEAIARDAVTNAVDFVESNIASDRIKAQRYYDGETDIGHEEGRSKVVATKVRDTIRAIKPSLMRVFLATDKPVEYVPTNPQDAPAAEQATSYVSKLFNEVGGYRIINDAFHDALLKRSGIVKAYWDTYEESETYEYSNLTDAEYSVIVNDDEVTVIEHEMTESMEVEMSPEMGMGMPEYQPAMHYLKISRKCVYGKLCVESIPPEEFFVDENAKSIDDAYVCVHRTEMRVGELVAMGYDFDEVVELTGLQYSDSFSETEDFYRRGYDQDHDDENVLDPSMRLVAVSEAYMKIDVEGTGIPQMHKILLGGNDYQLLDYEPWGEVPFAHFEIDPEPHAFFGSSIADLIINDQDAYTSMLRGVLDNVALTNNPQRQIIDGMVNVDDLLNNEIGSIIRVAQDGAVRDLSVPFVAGQTLGALQYFDQEIESKTGVTKASTGLSPDALQATTATAVAATVQAQAGQIEVMARNLAEGGMRRLFKLILKLVVENSDDQKMQYFSGMDYTPIDPRMWNTGMDVSVNVGLGTGQEDQKLATLNQTLQLQMQIMQGYGLQNGVVTLTNIRNTLGDMLAVGGVKNADRYFQPMNAQIEQQLQQQAAQAAQGQQQQDPQAQAYLQAEQLKAQQKAQSDMMKIQIEAQKAIAADDRERDKMDQDMLVKAAEILGKYGTAVDVERIKTMQNEPRYPQQTPAQAVQGGRF